jgi:hypothetical protein
MTIASVLLALILLQESTAKLKETITWLCNFTNAHSFLYGKEGISQTERLTWVQECTVQIDRQYLRAKSPTDMKREIAQIELGDFDPKGVKIQKSEFEGYASFEVDFERSDSADKIVSDAEMGDGRKTKTYASSVWIFMDSEESADRLARGLHHAIELCGGKPAPF